MPEKYQPPEENQSGQTERFSVPIQEPIERPPAPQQETNEPSFDKKIYGQWIKNNLVLAKIVSQLNAWVDPNIRHETIDELEAFCNVVVRDMHIVQQALVHAESRESAMQWLRGLIEQAQDNPDLFYKLQKTYIRARDMLGSHLDIINSFLGDSPSYARKSIALRTLITMRNYGLPDNQNSATALLRDHVHTADALVNSDFVSYADLLELIFSYGAQEDQDKWHEKINTFFEGNKYKKYFGRHAIASLFKSHDALARTHGNALTINQLHKYGLDGKAARDMILAWLASDTRKRVPGRIADNIGVLSELEEKQPGCIKRLCQEFGIKDFARYPMELLLTQDANRDNKDDPYGIIMYARYDYNGVMYEISGALQQLHQSLHGGYQIRVMEYEGKPQFGRRLLELRKRYGGEHKISFAVITEHGSKSRIGNLIFARQLEKKRVQHATDFLEKDATIILLSCSTGAAYGIGQGLSETLGMHVIAPDAPTNVNALHAEVKEGKLKFSIEYSQAQAQEYLGREQQPQKEENRQQ